MVPPALFITLLLFVGSHGDTLDKLKKCTGGSGEAARSLQLKLAPLIQAMSDESVLLDVSSMDEGWLQYMYQMAESATDGEQDLGNETEATPEPENKTDPVPEEVTETATKSVTELVTERLAVTEPVTEPVTDAVTEADILSDWDQCQTDLDYYLPPVKQAAICAGATLLLESDLIPGGLIGRTIREVLKGYAVPPEAPVQLWALKMIDASFKPPPGLTAGALHWPGDYEMCQSIDTSYTTEENGTRSLQGGYCRAQLSRDKENTSLSLAVGVCIPRTCTTSNITQYVDAGDVTFDLLNGLGFKVKTLFCGRPLDLEADSRGMTAICIIILLATIVLVASVYDTILRPDFLQRKIDMHSVKRRPGLHTVASHVSIDVNMEKSLITPATSRKNETMPVSMPDVNYVSVHPEDRRRYSLQEASSFTADAAAVAAPSSSLYPALVAALHTPVSTMHTLSIEANDAQCTESYLEQHATISERFEVAFVGFSCINSLKRLFVTDDPSRFRSCDFIRFFSFLYAMLGMTYVLGIIYTETWTTANFLFKFNELRQLVYWQPVINFTFCTDSFLVLSGMLVTYKWLKQIEDRRGFTWKMLLGFYAHRYWSLMPAYMFCTMFYTCLYEYFTSGPMVPPLITDAENCRNNWWINLLMLNNVVDPENACMAWTWYISLVFQLHIITPIILIPLTMYFYSGIVVLIILFCLHFAVASMVSIKLYENFGFNEWYYEFVMVPWTKSGAYFVGVVLGIVMFKIKDKTIKLPKIFTGLGWLVCITTITAIATSPMSVFSKELQVGEDDKIIFDKDEFRLDKIESVTLRAFGHTVWGLCIAWMIFTTETGHGGYLRDFLRCRVWAPLSKMVFMAFLISAIMIIKNTLVQVSLIYVTLNNMLYFLIGNTFIAMVVGLALGLIFQHPWIGVGRAFSFQLTKREAFKFACHHPLEDPTGEKAGLLNEAGKDNKGLCLDVETAPPTYNGYIDKDMKARANSSVHTTEL